MLANTADFNDFLIENIPANLPASLKAYWMRDNPEGVKKILEGLNKKPRIFASRKIGEFLISVTGVKFKTGAGVEFRFELRRKNIKDVHESEHFLGKSDPALTQFGECHSAHNFCHKEAAAEALLQTIELSDWPGLSG